MSKWRVEIKKKVADKQIPNLPLDVKATVAEAIIDLKAEGPRPVGWNVKQLEKNKMRLKLKHKWRMIYTYEKNELVIQIIYTGSRENVDY